MLKYTRGRMLAAITNLSTWAHPYADPFTCYADGGADGGQGDGADGDGDADGEEDGQGDADGGDADEEGDKEDEDTEALGEKGKKALRELRRENRRLKSQLRGQGEGQSREKSVKDGKSGDEGEDDAETIRERARQEAREEVWTERVEASAVAAAAGRLVNPERVVQLLGEDLADVPKDAKGRPDKAAISELIDDLLDTDPYLAVPATGERRRFQGDADGGARKKTKKSAANLGEAIANRLTAGKTG